jgi:hypothetical protein
MHSAGEQKNKPIFWLGLYLKANELLRISKENITSLEKEINQNSGTIDRAENIIRLAGQEMIRMPSRRKSEQKRRSQPQKRPSYRMKKHLTNGNLRGFWPITRSVYLKILYKVKI